MIRRCSEDDFKTIFEIINDAAQAYKGIIPAGSWKEPYISEEELAHEIKDGVLFWGYEKGGQLLGVMGMQDVHDVTLLRHAYVRTDHRGKGIGSRLLLFLRGQTERPILVGTWADAVWAISFYQLHGFRLTSIKEKNRLLRKYWSITLRQERASVVLAEDKWFETKL